MDRVQWIVRCSRELAKLRPDIDASIVERVAGALWLEHKQEAAEDTAKREASKWLGPSTGPVDLE